MIGRLRCTLVAALLVLGTDLAAAQSCTPESLGAAVDAAGLELRLFSAGAQPPLNQKLTALKEKKKWSGADYEQKVGAFLHDKRTAQLDAKADELLTKIDTLGRPDPGTPVSCATIDDVKASGSELLAVMKTKSVYINEKIDRELGSAPGAGQQTAEGAAPQGPTAKAPQQDTPAKAAQQDKVAKAEPHEALPSPVPKPLERPAPPAPKTNAEKSSSWNTTAEMHPPSPPPVEGFPDAPGAPYAPPSEEFTNNEDGYTIDEIREASRGFFGTISTSLGSVIEHAFRKSGRPTAYVLGTEGGGAFFAGLRYGDGTLYLRTGGTQKVYWHGPSLGSDFGADSSRTLFLIYRLHEPEGLFRQFTGVDGTAYLVGGVGITFLKGGQVLMAPIRAGLGLRFGASLGYVRFTPRPTWNPF
jgi:hypothetical protein